MIRFCKKCQAETDRYRNGACKPCGKTYAEAHRDSIKARISLWRAANKDYIKAVASAWREANPEYSVTWHAANPEYDRTWRAENPEKCKARSAKYYKENRDAVNARSAARYAKNPEITHAKSRNRRAKKAAADGSHSVSDINQLFTLQRCKCACCKSSIKDGYHVDHIIPLVAGGSNDRLNLQLLCPSCNLSKGAKHPVDFMQQRGYLL